jgi:multidrug resistance efflux pump
VRLAQRVPVRIALDGAERNDLVAGATATVEVLGSASRSEAAVAKNGRGVSQRSSCHMARAAVAFASSCG